MAPNGGCVCICIYLQEVNGVAARLADAAVSAELESGLLRAAGVPERAAARIFRQAGWAEHIYRLLDTRRLFLFLSYILYCYIPSAIFILFYPYYPLQPAEKLRRFRMCGINLRAACIGGGLGVAAIFEKC